ncbi:MAG: hypothetical protein JKX95_05285 [Bacteroidia bacterium]|nr:hypothetical protein [Bacteroidia bacterium]
MSYRVYKDYLIRKFADFALRYRLRLPAGYVALNAAAYGILPEKCIGLDLFAKYGLYQSSDFEEICDYFEMWEIDPEFARYAKKFFPKAEVQVGDSVDAVLNGKLLRKDYNLVLLDNPYGLYGNNSEYCEHFELFPPLLNYLDDKSVIAINVIYDIEVFENSQKRYNKLFNSDWEKRRNVFYNTNVPKRVPARFFLDFYQTKFTEWGWNVPNCFFTARQNFTGYVVVEIEKKFENLKI